MIKRALHFSRAFTWRRFLRGSKYVGAGAMIFDPEGRLLLIHNRLRNAWEYPVGGAHGSESPIETCRREVGEEVGLHLDNYRFLGTDFWHKVTPNGNLLFTFAAEVSSEQAASVVVQEFEVVAYQWATREEALGLVSAHTKPRLVHLLEAYDSGRPIYLHRGSTPNS